MGCQGCKDVPTPNIDSIATGGIRFTNGYVSCPICVPTRAGLMTGRYQQRFGFETNPGPEAIADPNFGLDLKEVTLAARLKEMGYATGMFGKWHIGYKPELQPTASSRLMSYPAPICSSGWTPTETAWSRRKRPRKPFPPGGHQPLPSAADGRRNKVRDLNQPEPMA